LRGDNFVLKTGVIMREHYDKGEILYLGAYIIYLTASIMSVAKIIHLFPFAGLLAYLKLFAAGVVFLKILLSENYNRNDMILFLILTALAIYSGIQAGTLTLFCAVCFIFGVRDISFSVILKISIIIQTIIMMITALAIQGGMIENEAHGSFVWQETAMDLSDLMRYDLGYYHPNTVSGIVLFFSFMLICYWKRCSLFTFCLCMIANYWVYQYTGSRTSFLVFVICLPIMFWFTHKRRIQKIWKVLLIVSPLILSMLAVLISIFYDPTVEWMYELDTLLSSRLRLGQTAFEEYGFLAFGQKIDWVNTSWENYNYVDSSYMRLLLDNGYLVFIVVIIVCIFTMYTLLKQEKREYAIAFLAVMVYAMIEPTIFSIENQPFYLLMGYIGKGVYDEKHKI